MKVILGALAAITLFCRCCGGTAGRRAVLVGWLRLAVAGTRTTTIGTTIPIGGGMIKRLAALGGNCAARSPLAVPFCSTGRGGRGMKQLLAIDPEIPDRRLSLR